MRWLVLFSSLVSAAAQPRQDLMADTLAAQRGYLEADAAYSELLHSRPDAPEILLKRRAIRMCLGRYEGGAHLVSDHFLLEWRTYEIDCDFDCSTRRERSHGNDVTQIAAGARRRG